jgi:hypothetical protein
MNQPAGDAGMADLERWLHKLAEHDRQVQAPAHVQTRVMQAWDAIAPLAAKRSPAHSGRAALLALASTAAGVLTAIAIYREPSAACPPVAASVSPAEIVLVTDPVFDPSATSIVRVRMPRAALATLGIPIADPDASGLVDVELLVGEDGFARTIRRVAAVAVQRE